MTRITELVTHDLRCATSRAGTGSDAVHRDPDYSAAYVVLHTDHPRGLTGHGMTFTIGRGNEVCVAAIQALRHHVVGETLEAIVEDFAGFHRRLTNDSQLRWLGPEKGVIQMATAAVTNGVWDLWAKAAGKPVWKLVADMTPEALLSCIDLRYLSDVLSADAVLDLLHRRRAGKEARETELRHTGYPAYITSTGWIGYPDATVRHLCRAALAAGWRSFKVKVGADPVADAHRLQIVREEIGEDCALMADANQAWDVAEAIDRVNRLAGFRLRWIEEPTSPDDILGHANIRRGVAPTGVATGEHCANKVIFKQLFQAEAIDYCQLDACRLGGLNEVLAVLMLAARFGVPVCPHAGGIGLAEYVQHISLIDYLCISATLEDRTTEYTDHLHEHFVDPVTIRNGRYTVPLAPGFSIEMHQRSIAALAFPNGSEWRGSAQRLD